MAAPQRPGEAPRKPGEYEERDSKGRRLPDAGTITIEPSDGKLPPTQKPGHTWVRIGPPKPARSGK